MAASANWRSGRFPSAKRVRRLDGHDLASLQVDDRLQMDRVLVARDDPLDPRDRDVLVLRQLDRRTKHGDDEFGRVDQVGQAV